METISPELVLVDPELARRARAQLPDSSVSNGNVTSVVADAIAGASRGQPIVGAGAFPLPLSPAGSSPPVRAGETGELESQHRGALGQKLLLTAAGLFSFLLGVLLASVLARSDPVPSSQPKASPEPKASELLARPASTGSALERTDLPGHTRTDRKPGRRASTRREMTTRQTPAPPPSPPSTSSPKTSPRKGSRVPKHGGVATQLFVWLPSRGARYYHVRFFKDKRTVFEAWPTDPRVTVPLRGSFRGRRFAFTSGRYRWTVRPAFGPRGKGPYGEPIVRSIWVVRA
jgi:hypothetical protein